VAISLAVVNLIQSVAFQFGLPEERLHSQVLAESSGDPNAKGPFGEVGLMQLSKPLLTDLGITEKEGLDPGINLRAGAGYLRRLLDQFKALAPELREMEIYRIALWGYNGGPGYVKRAISMLREKGEAITIGNLEHILPQAKVSGRSLITSAVITYAERILSKATVLAKAGGAPLAEATGIQLASYTGDTTQKVSPKKKSKSRGILLLLLTIGALVLVLKK